MQDVADEERVHAGEFQRLLSLLLSDEDALMKKGADEVDEMAESGGPVESDSSADVKTVGNLKM